GSWSGPAASAKGSAGKSHTCCARYRWRGLCCGRIHMVGRRGREAEWSRFLKTLGAVFPKPFSATLGPTELFVLAQDGTPGPVKPKLGLVRRLLRPLFGALVPALKAMLAMKGLSASRAA